MIWSTRHYVFSVAGPIVKQSRLRCPVLSYFGTLEGVSVGLTAAHDDGWHPQDEQAGVTHLETTTIKKSLPLPPLTSQSRKLLRAHRFLFRQVGQCNNLCNNIV